MKQRKCLDQLRQVRGAEAAPEDQSTTAGFIDVVEGELARPLGETIRNRGSRHNGVETSGTQGTGSRTPGFEQPARACVPVPGRYRRGAVGRGPFDRRRDRRAPPSRASRRARARRVDIGSPSDGEQPAAVPSDGFHLTDRRRGSRTGRRGTYQPPNRGSVVHQCQDRERARLEHPHASSESPDRGKAAAQARGLGLVGLSADQGYRSRQGRTYDRGSRSSAAVATTGRRGCSPTSPTRRRCEGASGAARHRPDEGRAHGRARRADREAAKHKDVGQAGRSQGGARKAPSSSWRAFSVGGFEACATTSRSPSATDHAPIGDTVGPGSVMRALALVPVVLDIAARHRSGVTGALFVNVTNPLTALCRAVTRETNVQTVGLCNELVGMQYVVSLLLDADMRKLDPVVGGVNHLPLVTELPTPTATRLAGEAARSARRSPTGRSARRCGWIPPQAMEYEKITPGERWHKGRRDSQQPRAPRAVSTLRRAAGLRRSPRRRVLPRFRHTRERLRGTVEGAHLRVAQAWPTPTTTSPSP